VLIAVFFIYGTLYLINGEIVYDRLLGAPVRKLDYLKKVAASLLPVYPFYVFSKKGQLTTKTISYWLPVIIVLAVFEFFQYYNMKLAMAEHLGSGQTEFTNNTGYVFVTILPLVFIKQRKLLMQYVMLAVIVIFAVMSVKRGAILITGLSICFYLYTTLSQAKTSQKLKYVLLTFIGIIIAGYYISDYISQSIYFSERLQATIEGDSNGRDGIFTSLWQVFVDSNVFNQLFGHGPDSTIIYSGSLAHNDWLEILINQGLFGAIIYLIFFQKVYRTWRKYRQDPIVGVCLGGLFIVLFIRTLFSMSYTEYTLAICMAFGFCMAKVNQLELASKNGKRIA